MKRCKLCGWVWTPRKKGKPKACPRCKSYQWDRKRKLSMKFLSLLLILSLATGYACAEEKTTAMTVLCFSNCFNDEDTDCRHSEMTKEEIEKHCKAVCSPYLDRKKDCQDPSTLSPKLRQAYEELKELLKDEEGISVKIRCKEEK